MRVTKDMARVIRATVTASGEPAILVECVCGHHSRTGNRAIVAMTSSPDTSPTAIHRSVLTAHHPLALQGDVRSTPDGSVHVGRGSVKRFGPWAVRA